MVSKIRTSKQQDIFKAAIEVFSEKGLDQASMEGIAKLASVSKRTLYKYYPNKDVLFQEIIDSLLCRFTEGDGVAFQPDVDTAEQLTQFLVDKMEYLTREDFVLMSRLVIAECMKTQSLAEVAANKLAQIDKIEGGYGLHSWVEQGEELGKLKVDNKAQVLEQLIGAIKGVCFWPQMLGFKETVSKPELAHNIHIAAKAFAKSYSL